MKIKKSQRNNLLFLALILLFIIPQTRKPIQVFLHKGLAQISPGVTDESDRERMIYSDWILQNLDGDNINFKDLKGKVVVLNFWATWCPPCIAELPHLEDLNDDFGDKIEIILISNESQKTVKSFLDAKGYNITSYTPESNYPENLNIRSIPRTFLIDKTGEIIIDKTGAANWNSERVREQIEKLLK